MDEHKRQITPHIKLTLRRTARISSTTTTTTTHTGTLQLHREGLGGGGAELARPQLVRRQLPHNLPAHQGHTLRDLLLVRIAV